MINGTVLDGLKIVRVVPGHKKGNRTYFVIYRTNSFVGV